MKEKYDFEKRETCYRPVCYCLSYSKQEEEERIKLLEEKINKEIEQLQKKYGVTEELIRSKLMSHQLCWTQEDRQEIENYKKDQKSYTQEIKELKSKLIYLRMPFGYREKEAVDSPVFNFLNLEVNPK